MGYIRCPRCELNYMKDTEEMCDVCANKHKSSSPVDKPIIKHKGRNIFMVFQGQNYFEEILKCYICAPYEDAAGHSPSHWTMLENINPGDIIFHGLMQGIVAISIASSSCFSDKRSPEKLLEKLIVSRHSYIIK